MLASKFSTLSLKLPNASVLDAVGSRNTQMSANERKRAQRKSAKERKRAQKSASA